MFGGLTSECCQLLALGFSLLGATPEEKVRSRAATRLPEKGRKRGEVAEREQVQEVANKSREQEAEAEVLQECGSKRAYILLFLSWRNCSLKNGLMCFPFWWSL